MADSGKNTLDVTKAWASASWKHERQLSCCRFSPDGKFVVGGGLDSALQRWNIESGEQSSLAGNSSWLGEFAFAPDGKRLFAGDFHGALLCWSFGDQQPAVQWSVKDTGHGWVRSVSTSRNGELVATSGNDGVVRLWSTADGTLVRELKGHANYVFSIAFHPDGKSLVSGDLLGRVHHWEVDSGKLVLTLDARALHTRGDDFLADVGGVRAMAFNADGKQLACGGMSDAKSNSFCPGDPLVIVFDWASGNATSQLRPKQKADGPINGLRFLPDGSLAGVGEGSGGASIAFWKVDSPAPVHEIKTNSGYSLDLHPDGLRLAVALFEANGRGGNGRHAKPEEYVSNNGVVQIYNLFEKPSAG